MALIMFKRGEALNIPALKPGEPGWCLDTGELFIGTNDTVQGNILVGSGFVGDISEVEERLGTLEDMMQALQNNGKVTGGDIYIQNTPPTTPNENDIWFDLSLIGE